MDLMAAIGLLSSIVTLEEAGRSWVLIVKDKLKRKEIDINNWDSDDPLVQACLDRFKTDMGDKYKDHIFSKEEMEKMASNSKYYAEKMHSIQGALRMSEEINAQFGFERAFGKTTEIGNSIDSDMKITKFGISFNSDGSTSFFAQLEKTSENQKDYLEKIQEKKAAEKKEAKKKERSTQVNIKRATVEANSKEELLDKIKNIEWDSIKPEDNKIGSRFDFSI